METAFRSEERFTQAEFFEWLQSRPRGDIQHTDRGFGRALLVARGDVVSSVLPGLKIPLDEIFAGLD